MKPSPNRFFALAHCAFNVLRGRPILAIFDVTKLCNQHCPMCNIRKDSSADMTNEEIARVALRLRKFGVAYVFIQGGEPLLRDDILDIIDGFTACGIKPTVITNGVNLTRPLAEQLARRKCNLTLSIDSLEKDKYAALRGSDDLDTVLNNIENICDITERGGNWAITSTITKLSDPDDIDAIAAYAKARGFMFAIRPYISVSGVAGKYNAALKYTAEDILCIFQRYAAAAKRENYLAYLMYCEHIKYIRGEKMPECDALKYSLLVRENGAMAPCIEMPDCAVDLDSFKADRKKYRPALRTCNAQHPCFYNDAREIGVLYRNKFRVLLHFAQIVGQMKKYTNFF